ncbi:hypothetical protein MMPV_009917 [Pyropia vietnamensis]
MRRQHLPGVAAAARVSTPRLALMVSADLGLSFCWVLKYALATPHLAHTLGASAAVSHALWALGPLTGLLAPLIGTLSDGHTSRYGRRRPFVAAGAAASVVGMTVFAWAGSVLPAGRGVATVVAFAGFGLWDVGLQAMLFPSRALLADILPADRQHDVQAVAAVLAGVAEVTAGGLVWSMAEPVASIRSLLAGGAAVLLLTTAVSLVLCVETPTDGSVRVGDVELATIGDGDAWWEGHNGEPRRAATSSVAAPFLEGPSPNGVTSSVTIFSAASVVKAVAGLAFGGCYPMFLRSLGGGGERTLLGGPLGAYAVVLWAVAGTRSGWVAGFAVAAAAVPFVVTQTIPVAMVVTPPGGGSAGAGGALLDTCYTGWVAGRFGEAAVLRIGGAWAAASAAAAFVLL